MRFRTLCTLSGNALLLSMIFLPSIFAARIVIDANNFRQQVHSLRRDFATFLKDLSLLLVPTERCRPVENNTGVKSKAKYKAKDSIDSLVQELSHGLKVADIISHDNRGTTSLLNRIEDHGADILKARVLTRPDIWTHRRQTETEISAWKVLFDLLDVVLAETFDWKSDFYVGLWLFDAKKLGPSNILLDVGAIEETIQVMRDISKVLHSIYKDINQDIEQYKALLSSFIRLEENPNARRDKRLKFSADGVYAFFLSDEAKEAYDLVSRSSERILAFLENFAFMSFKVSKDLERIRVAVQKYDEEARTMEFEKLLETIQSNDEGSIADSAEKSMGLTQKPGELPAKDLDFEGEATPKTPPLKRKEFSFGKVPSETV